MAKGFDKSVQNERQSVCSSRLPQNRVNSCATNQTDVNSNRSQSEDCSIIDNINTIDINSNSNVINENFLTSFPSLTVMPTTRSQPSLDETEAVARELFTQFTREQFTYEGISQSEIDQQLQQFSTNGYSIATPLMASVGRDLRRISEAFAQSAERAQVRERAFRINITDLTNEEFALLLSELFLNGNITRERIVVLFFFCSDLAVRAFTNGPIVYFKRLIQWSLRYIIDNICSWVQRQGGWEVVLGDYFPRVAITVCAVLGCLAFGIYIRRNMF